MKDYRLELLKISEVQYHTYAFKFRNHIYNFYTKTFNNRNERNMFMAIQDSLFPTTTIIEGRYLNEILEVIDLIKRDHDKRLYAFDGYLQISFDTDELYIKYLECCMDFKFDEIFILARIIKDCLKLSEN